MIESFEFSSVDHIRYENGIQVSGPHGGAPRLIKVEPNIKGGRGYTVTIYNTDGQKTIQMAPKQMEIIDQNDNQVILRGFGNDQFGNTFSDYGLTINYKKNNSNPSIIRFQGVFKGLYEQFNNSKIIENCILHLIDRDVEVKYLSSEENPNTVSQALFLNYENAFKYLQEFISLPIAKKKAIASKTDELNNIGVDYYESDDIMNAIKYYNKALEVFLLNDDALKNLILCYREINDFENMSNAQNSLDIVRRLGL